MPLARLVGALQVLEDEALQALVEDLLDHVAELGLLGDVFHLGELDVVAHLNMIINTLITIINVITVLIGYCDYHPVTKSPKIGCYDY